MEALAEVGPDLRVIPEELRGENELVLEVEPAFVPAPLGVSIDSRAQEGQGPGVAELAPGPERRDRVRLRNDSAAASMVSTRR